MKIKNSEDRFSEEMDMYRRMSTPQRRVNFLFIGLVSGPDDGRGDMSLHIADRIVNHTTLVRLQIPSGIITLDALKCGDLELKKFMSIWVRREDSP